MHLPVEYIILASVAAFLLIALVCLICYLFCRRSPGGVSKTADEPDGVAVVGYVPAHIPDASVYVIPDMRPQKGREASPTELVAAGFTATQLIDENVAREATKTELLATGFTKSQLQAADIIPKEKKSEKRSKGEKAKKPLKFDSRADDGGRARGRGRKRSAGEDDEDDEEVDRTVRKKRSAPDLYEQTDQKKEQVRPGKADSFPAVRRRRKSSDEKVRTVVRDSKEQIRSADKNRAAKSPAKNNNEIDNMTHFFG